MTQRTFVTRQMSETVTRDAWPGDSLCNQCTAYEEYSLLASLMILPIVRGFSWKSRPLLLFYPLLPTPWLPPLFSTRFTFSSFSISYEREMFSAWLKHGLPSFALDESSSSHGLIPRNRLPPRLCKVRIQLHFYKH